MARKGFKPEQIIHMLREAEVRLAGGSTVGEVCRALGVSEQSYSTAGARSTAVCRSPRPRS